MYIRIVSTVLGEKLVQRGRATPDRDPRRSPFSRHDGASVDLGNHCCSELVFFLCSPNGIRTRVATLREQLGMSNRCAPAPQFLVAAL